MNKIDAKILINRGIEKELPTLTEGEPAYTTDTEKVFIGSSSGNVELAKNDDYKTLIATPKIKTWTATVGQLIYTFDTDSYTIGQGQLKVYVGGVQQIPIVNFTETSTTSFRLTCDASEITAGLTVIAIYR